MAGSYRRVSFETKLRRALKRVSSAVNKCAPRDAVNATFYLPRFVTSTYGWHTALLTGDS